MYQGDEGFVSCEANLKRGTDGLFPSSVAVVLRFGIYISTFDTPLCELPSQLNALFFNYLLFVWQAHKGAWFTKSSKSRTTLPRFLMKGLLLIWLW